MAITASADGSTIYVGGDFDQVNGAVAQPHRRDRRADRRAARRSNPGANTRVDALAVNGNTVYFGGDFTTVGTTAAGFTARTRLAAVERDDGRAAAVGADCRPRSSTRWSCTPPSGRVIVGGGFNTLNATQAWGMGSLDGVTGAVQPWAANTVIQNHDDGCRDQLAHDRRREDLRRRLDVHRRRLGRELRRACSRPTRSPASSTGSTPAAATTTTSPSPATCVYTVGHPHDWGMLDWNPQTDPWQFQRAGAINKHTSPTLTNAVGTPGVWGYFPGLPGGAAVALVADADRRYVHRSGASGVERRHQR